MNKITATGRLAADSEIRYTPKGEAILNFRMASDIGYGERKTTNWFACTIFGKRGESLEAHLKKGQQVTVFGSLVLREWTTKEGAKQLSPDIRVDEIELMGSKPASSDAPRESKKPNEKGPVDSDGWPEDDSPY